MSLPRCKDCLHLGETPVGVLRGGGYAHAVVYHCEPTNQETVPGVPSCLRFEPRLNKWIPREPEEALKPITLDAWSDEEDE